MMTDARCETLLLQLSEQLIQQNKMLVTAESCTGGGIAYAITEIPGSSGWFERGFVTYSNLAKQEQLGVARKVTRPLTALSFEPIQWDIKDFHLIESVTHQQGARYQVIRSWPLSWIFINMDIWDTHKRYPEIIS